MSSQLVDLHCHILPGIDDGAKNLDVSMSLIQKLSLNTHLTLPTIA